MRARVSFSMTEWFNWYELNFREKKHTGRSTPFLSDWSNTAPAPTSFVSNCSSNRRSIQGATRTGGEHKTVLTFSKACWYESYQMYFALAFNKSVKGATIVEALVTHQAQKMHVLLLGGGHWILLDCRDLCLHWPHLPLPQLPSQGR